MCVSEWNEWQVRKWRNSTKFGWQCGREKKVTDCWRVTCKWEMVRTIFQKVYWCASLPFPPTLHSMNFPSYLEGLSLIPANPLRWESYTPLGQEVTMTPDRQWQQMIALKFKNSLLGCEIERLKCILAEPVYPTFHSWDKKALWAALTSCPSRLGLSRTDPPVVWREKIKEDSCLMSRWDPGRWQAS